MIFATDLDRTLIYSNRALEEFGAPEKSALLPVEKKDEKWISYMTKASFDLLKEIHNRFLFIPVTTRTTEQFRRIYIFQKDIPVTYAITSNGGHILYKGEELEEWTDILSAKLQNETASIKEMQSYLQRESFCFDGVLKQAEELFFYFILNLHPSGSMIRKIAEEVADLGWRISLQGRKLYFIPKVINKGDALEYICEREGITQMAGAGDSNLDWDFLKNCQFRYVPVHGELASKKYITGDSISNHCGILAGEEILQNSLSLLSS
jgi:hydroxymethylpyrimidine pyrophosphatase-like HAD family hydrolase